MGLKAVVLTGAVLATMTIGVAAPAFAAAQAAPRAVPQLVNDSDDSGGFDGLNLDPVVFSANTGIPAQIAESAFGR
jgi:hypothetical protein